MHILFLSRWFPYPPDNGARIRIFNLLSGLGKSHEIDLVSFYENPITQGQLDELNKICKVIGLVEYKVGSTSERSSILNLFSITPRSYRNAYNREFARITSENAAKRYDLVIASQIDMAPYAVNLPIPKKIFEELEITKILNAYKEEYHLLKKIRHWLTWSKLTYYVDYLLKKFDGCTVVSNFESDAVKKIAPKYNSLWVVPNGVNTKRLKPVNLPPDPDTLIYNGALTYNANFDAVKFFLEEIFPHICLKKPGVRFLITGSTQGVALEKLNITKNVILTGYLDEIYPVIQRSTACVVPLRWGGGTRLKILEAMALGIPVISTRKGVEGLDLKWDVDVLVSDDPEMFAGQVLRILDDSTLRARIAQSARLTVEKLYDWEPIVQSFHDKLMNEISLYKWKPTHD